MGVPAALGVVGGMSLGFCVSAPCPLDGQGNGLDGKRSWQKRSYTNWWLLFNVSYSRRDDARCKDLDRQAVLLYQDHR